MAKKKQEPKPRVFKVEIEITHRKSFMVMATSEEEAQSKVEIRHDEMDPCDDEGESINVVACDHEYEINT